MDRRDFFKILSATSAGAAGCSRKTDTVIPLLVAEHEIVPGEEQWHPAVCTECAAGCGTIVRVMEGIRTVERNGETVRERIAAVKKIEGNPLDPVGGGRLCARGQAAVQGLYHPARLRGPVKRVGKRGEAKFAPISWDEAIAAAAAALSPDVRARVTVLTTPVSGSRSAALEAFAKGIGAPPPSVCSLASCAVERHAADLVFGWKGLPVYDLARARHVLGVGADFLGGWASPVYYARQFGHFRQGRPGIRGYLAHAESRLSITAAAADRWLPIRPGSEPQFLLAVGRILGAGEPFASADAASLLAACGSDEHRVREAVQAESGPPLVLAGASVVHANSLEAIALAYRLNWMLGTVGKPGGVLPPAAASNPPDFRAAEALAHADVVLLAGANPALTVPGGPAALARARAVISFASHPDESTAYADLVLPDHHALESALAVVPTVTPQPATSLAVPFIRPLYDTRPVEQTLAGLARKLNVEYQPPSLKDFLPNKANFDDAVREGGFREASVPPAVPDFKPPSLPPQPAAPPPDPSYPLAFQAYPSLQFQDGSGGHLPWLQELPDPASSSIWGLPVEIDPRTAAALRITNGDVVRVESPHGSIEAPAYVHPGAIPGVVSMAMGDGKTNPISILAPAFESSTGVLLTGGTRVRLARVGPRRAWIQFAAPDREERGSDYR
jgi:anaerobic selenocysteine-containing dehydrogenase